ncbi:hypothetical protein CERSUDRAFT_108989 [Gelatoporia subvermispora B]|uniref:Uncharacterized protein n=1 Tax=Ceriporiopsis subvermispora (strain B) TaxID=914234 RepID=M2QIY0_CERS8|nr:hypothetical protein CERSUDRAFT_108989 [Gelatoporia subvermispora B]
MQRIAAASSTTSQHRSTQRARKRKLLREHLVLTLETLGTLQPPPTLPSPPASRSGSPQPGTKRRPPADIERGQTKKPRTSVAAPSQPRPPVVTTYLRSEPSEEGELHEDPPAPAPVPAPAPGPAPAPAPAPASASAPAPVAAPPTTPVYRNPPPQAPLDVPVRRPRRGRPTSQYWDELSNKFHLHGRALKYSGTARIWSTYPTTHKDYHPLTDPPPVGSMYHKYGHLIARLELLDALSCFAYGFWCRDMQRGARNLHSWRSITGYLGYCRERWASEDITDECERAFLGLVWLLEGFIHTRIYVTEAKLVAEDCAGQLMRLRALAEAEAARVSSTQSVSPTVQPPAMLPSPVTDSANSTPTNRSTDTPDASSSRTAPPAPPPRPPPQRSGDPWAPENLPDSHHTIPIHAAAIASRHLVASSVGTARIAFQQAQRYITLPLLAKHYPRTFARMVHSSLAATDEHEPDMDDTEGELFWPGLNGTGEGIAWVCLMTKAMISEFSSRCGYMGFEGVVPKPNGPEGSEMEGPSADTGPR